MEELKEKEEIDIDNNNINNVLPSPIKIPDSKPLLTFGSTPVGVNSKIRKPTDLSSSVDSRRMSDERNSGGNINSIPIRSSKLRTSSLYESEIELPSQSIKTVDEIEDEIQHAIKENEKIISTRVFILYIIILLD